MEVGCCTTFGALVKRDVLKTFRNPLLFKARIIQYIFLGLYLGGLFFDAGDRSYTSTLGWSAIIGLLFELSINSMMSFLTPIALIFPLER